MELLAKKEAASDLRVGMAEADITPPVGFPMAGYYHERLAEGAIDPLTPRNGQPAEFDSWRWERLDRVADLVVPFRREVYRMVAREFTGFAR